MPTPRSIGETGDLEKLLPTFEGSFPFPLRWMENREWVLIRTDALFPDRKGYALFPENAGEAIWHQSKNEAASREVTD